MQEHGTVNTDGFGVGWYQRSIRPEPAVHRSTYPIWADRSFESAGGLIATEAVLAAVRSATEPVLPLEHNVPPFASGRYLFAHNGAIDGFRQGISSVLRRRLSEPRDSEILGTTDSEVIFALVLDSLDRGVDLVTSVMDVTRVVREIATARLNLVLMDGERIAAVTCGDTLFVHHDGESTFVCSEPFDDSSMWKPIDDLTVLEATSSAISIEPLR
jgi:glutamine amidotransferase